jgi:hypothetical protein
MLRDQVFIYCERGLDPAFWAEPLNALSNAGFLLVATLAAAALVSRGRRATIVEWLLVSLVAAIGIGSFLFHTFAERWSGLADTIPIMLFMLVYLAAALRSFLAMGSGTTGLALAAFCAAILSAGAIRCDGGPCLNGSMGYVPALVALAVVGGVGLRRGDAWGRPLLAAAGIFLASLLLRSIDMRLCQATRILGEARGTHVLWHLLNALLIHVLLQTMIAHGRRRG